MSIQSLAQFTFKSHPCDVAIQTLVDPVSGKMIENLAIKPRFEIDLEMAYHYGEGLKLTNDKSFNTKNNILGEFLGIKKDDLKGFKSFFEKYGFLFPLPASGRYTEISINEIIKLQFKLMNFIKIINNQPIQENQFNNINFRELIDGIMYHFFVEKLELHLDGEIIFTTSENMFLQKLNSAISHSEADFGTTFELINGQLVRSFKIPDSFSSDGINVVEYEWFAELLNEESDIPNWVKHLLRLYKNKDRFFIEDDEQFYKIAVDFLFRFVTEHNYFDLEYIRNNGSFDDEVYDYFSARVRYKRNLIEICKHLITNEFNNNLNSVKPTYDPGSMKPSWELPSLYCSLYYSLFYLDHKETGLRKCANQNCNEYFQISKTNSVKKYCCILCTNAVSQRKYQNKKRETE